MKNIIIIIIIFIETWNSEGKDDKIQDNKIHWKDDWQDDKIQMACLRGSSNLVTFESSPEGSMVIGEA